MSVPRILLVDDQREVSRLLRSSLELSGKEYIVVDVPSGEEALLELSRGPVDLLVTDLRLPGISGLELLVRVRQLNPDARAILITGHPSEEARTQAEKLGVVAFLPKPIGTSIFLEAVEHALRLRRAMEPLVHVHEEARTHIADRLSDVRHELGAEAALLIDDHGKVVVQVGELAGLDLGACLPSLMTAFSAGIKVSSLVGALLPGNLQYFDGDTHDLYITNVGAYYALLIIFHSKRDTGQIGAVVHYGRRAAEGLMDMLSSLGNIDALEDDISQTTAKKVEWVERTTQSASEVKGDMIGHAGKLSEDYTEAEEDVVTPDLDTLGQDIVREDADQFWDQAVSESPLPTKSDGGILTYEEARDKGLLADQPDKEPSEDEG